MNDEELVSCLNDLSTLLKGGELLDISFWTDKTVSTMKVRLDGTVVVVSFDKGDIQIVFNRKRYSLGEFFERNV